MWLDFKRDVGCFLSDSNGQLSHARLIAVLVGFSATVFMWKLTIMGDLTTDYFLYYLSYGVIHMNVSKFLDVLNNFLGGKAMKEFADHQVMEEQLIEPKEAVDEDDVMSLLDRTFAVLTTVLESRLKAQTRSDVIKLIKDIEDVIWFHHLH